jgi:hypothetical protein
MKEVHMGRYDGEDYEKAAQVAKAMNIQGDMNISRNPERKEMDVPSRPVERGLTVIAESASELRHVIQQLESRLGPVLASIPVPGAEDCSERDPGRSEVVALLDSHNNYLADTIQLVRNIISALEV